MEVKTTIKEGSMNHHNHLQRFYYECFGSLFSIPFSTPSRLGKDLNILEPELLNWLLENQQRPSYDSLFLFKYSLILEAERE